jgi:glycine/D-amino acid oxidase-like deaminating enzyme
MTLDRRRFLQVAGASALGAGLGACAPALRTSRRGPAPDVVVVGAGAFGGWTAYHLRRMGASVTLVDMFGPGNSRSTSGDETRGVRSSYGERLTWVRWANEAMGRWRAWDLEHAARLGLRVFFSTGDLILRPADEPWLADTRASWDRLGVRYEMLTIDEVRYRYPQISVEGMTVAALERDAGVVRARRACEAVAEVFRSLGGRMLIARAEYGRLEGDRLLDLTMSSGNALGGGAFVFACGPWLPKAMPDVMANRLRTPLGHVYYFGTPPGDGRWLYPNFPSYNVPGVTGWPGLPVDNRGFRVRVGGRPPQDPDESVRWIDASFHERARSFVAERFPDLRDAPIIETRACHYESSVDRNFIVDRHPEMENVWIAGGGSAEGFKFGPVIGEYIARRVLGERTDPALDEEFRLKPETFEQLPARNEDEEAFG